MCMLTFSWHSHQPTQPHKHTFFFLIIHKNTILCSYWAGSDLHNQTLPRFLVACRWWNALRQKRTTGVGREKLQTSLHLSICGMDRKRKLQFSGIWSSSSFSSKTKQNIFFFTNSVIISHICCSPSTLYLGTQHYGCWNKSRITPEFVNLPQPNSGKCFHI